MGTVRASEWREYIDINSPAAERDEDGPEREFAGLWTAGESWKEAFKPLLRAYYDGVTTQLGSQAGSTYCRLAESRRERVRGTPIAEFRLLFPVTDIDGKIERSMRPDGTVAKARS